MRRLLTIGLLLVAAPAYAQRSIDPRERLLDTANECHSIDVMGMGTAAVQVISNTGTVTWNVSADGASYEAIDAFKPETPGTAANSTTSTGIWTMPVAGLRTLRACIGGSGVATVVLAAAGTGGSGGGGGSGGTVTLTLQETDDASIAAGQAADAMITLGQAFDGTVWRRVTFGTAGTASAQVWTVQGVASMTPLLVNPGTATLFGVHAEDSAHSTTHAGVQILGVRQDAQVDFGADGDYVPLSINDAGEVRVAFSGAAGGTSLADDGDVTAGTTPATLSSGFYQSTVTACTDGDGCIAGITAQRAWKVTLYNEAGAALTPSADWTVSSAISTTAPGLLLEAKDFDGAVSRRPARSTASRIPCPLEKTVRLRRCRPRTSGRRPAAG
jgi:hypothetical protein